MRIAGSLVMRLTANPGAWRLNPARTLEHFSDVFSLSRQTRNPTLIHPDEGQRASCVSVNTPGMLNDEGVLEKG